MFGSHTIETACAFSAVMGALSVPAVWLLAGAVGASRRAGWMACLLVAVCPPLVYLGQEARCFALLVTLATLVLAAVAFIERNDRPAAWVGFALAGIVMVHVHYYGFFVLTVLGLYLLAWAWRQRRWTAVLRLGVVAVVVALCFVHYVPSVLEQIRRGEGRAKGIWWEHLGMMPAFSIIGRTLVWKEAGRIAVLASVVLVALMVYLPAAWLLTRGRAWPRLLPAFVIGLPALVVLISLRVPMISSHYLSVTFTALMMLLALAVDAGLRTRSHVLLGVMGLTLAVLMPAAKRAPTWSNTRRIGEPSPSTLPRSPPTCRLTSTRTSVRIRSLTIAATNRGTGWSSRSATRETSGGRPVTSTDSTANAPASG